jgi:hypothetical protein
MRDYLGKNVSNTNTAEFMYISFILIFEFCPLLIFAYTQKLRFTTQDKNCALTN